MTPVKFKFHVLLPTSIEIFSGATRSIHCEEKGIDFDSKWNEDK
jgi:hypothetical protein